MDKNLIRLDTRKIDEAIGMRDKLLKTYSAIQDDFDAIEEKLLLNWKGKGADEFKKDAQIVRTNIAGLNDVLQTMCDMLQDCRDIFAECDSTLGEFNKEPKKE